MTVWLVALLVVVVLAAFVWVARRDDGGDEDARRRTAEDRLRELEARNVRRRDRDQERRP